MEGKGYNLSDNIINKLREGNGFIKEYKSSKLVFEYEYLNGK